MTVALHQEAEMTSQPTAGEPVPVPTTGRPPRIPAGTAVVIAVLLGVPVLALLDVPLYAKEDPYLWGFPFFYWWQFLWMFIETAMVYAAYLLIKRARRNTGQR